MFGGLQSSVHALEAQVDATTRKAATAETILKNITQERDSAVSQLGVAYFTIEQLKGDNEALREENHDLKTRIGQLTVNHESETQEKNSLKARIGQLTTNCESETQKNNDLRARMSQITTSYESETQKNNDLRARMSQITTSYESETQKWTAKEEAMQRKLQEVKTMVAKFNPPSSGPGSKSASAARFPAPTEDQGLNEAEANASTHKEVDTLFDFSGTPRAAKDMSKHVQQAAQLETETTQESHHAASEISKGRGKAQGKESLGATSNQNDGTSMDLTYLSYVDVSLALMLHLPQLLTLGHNRPMIYPTYGRLLSRSVWSGNNASNVNVNHRRATALLHRKAPLSYNLSILSKYFRARPL